ncbi:ABC transporter permease [Rhizobium sp. VS19-DR104.2]|uniref:ABC transporter permease n=1 Tax=unclassified Rhizobium TaxID=2613769 RepID=UPI001C5AD943|nr:MULTISPECIES: ABC transporter permease [unclassified Rhizobium]MBZ5762745.1 ABC transporter permease [Rhizobium sp. VS19-DR96]MBZ5768686.1 ABC transporter permease [Rhizobium sp. VS19-DR129.2]MBZ5776197.1 ABC transporter permease [Rhizobium sp. VS19-DRK62.2]MBZ5787057.1 ABC transporter permease [Rhizobium sp. VS19-DR121]MBZ5804760.1 ABC transporter permease [Rhizobium sp. VS19-DR181]
MDPVFHRAQLAVPVACLLIVGCILPLALLAVFSVFEVDLDAFTLVPAFSGKSWAQMFSNPVFAFLIGKAVVSGAGTAVLAATVGYPIAISMTRLPVLWKGIGSIVLLTPLYTGEIVRIYAWRVVLGSEGLINAALQWVGIIREPLKFLLFTPFTTHLVLLYNNLPFMVLAIWISAELIDHRLIEAARDLGARPLDAFFKVILPLTTPGLAVGVFTVFALAAGDMMTPSLLGGTSGATPMAMIDNLFGTAFDWPLASALSLSLLIVLFVLASGFLTILLRVSGAKAVFRWGAR